MLLKEQVVVALPSRSSMGIRKAPRRRGADAQRLREQPEAAQRRPPGRARLGPKQPSVIELQKAKAAFKARLGSNPLSAKVAGSGRATQRKRRGGAGGGGRSRGSGLGSAGATIRWDVRLPSHRATVGVPDARLLEDEEASAEEHEPKRRRRARVFGVGGGLCSASRRAYSESDHRTRKLEGPLLGPVALS